MTFIRSSRCKVCKSRWMDEYHKLREQGKTYKDLQAIAKGNGENISHQAFRRHFNTHWFEYLDRIQKNEDTAEAIVFNKLTASVNLVDEIHTNLNTLRELTASAIKLAQEDPRQVRYVTELLKETRQTLDLILKLQEKLDFEPREDKRTIVKKVLRALQNLVPKEVLAEWAHELETFI